MKTTRISKMGIGAILCMLSLSFGAYGQEKPKLSDPEVAFIAVTANRIDIDFAGIAKHKSKDPEIIKFAETMQRDHQAVIDQATALAKKLGVTPQNCAVAKSMQAEGEKTKKNLKSKSGKAFNKAYIDNEVAYHKAVIAAVEGVLIPETDNNELKQLLQNVVPALKAHLIHAEMVQKNYNK